MNNLLFRLAVSRAVHNYGNLANLNNTIGHPLGERSALVWDTGLSGKGVGREDKKG